MLSQVCGQSAAAQCGFCSLADFSRTVSRFQLRPSLQQEFPTRGPGQARGEAACGAGAAVGRLHKRISRFYPEIRIRGGSASRPGLPAWKRRGGLAAPGGGRVPRWAGCEAVAEMGHFLRGCRSPGPGGFDRGANIWGQIYIK